MRETYCSQAFTALTKHASKRSQQRAIPHGAIDLILDFGKASPAGSGAHKYRFDKRAWAEAKAALGRSAAQFEKFRKAYVIEAADGSVITAAWSY
jgi:hypothetical protein